MFAGIEMKLNEDLATVETKLEKIDEDVIKCLSLQTCRLAQLEQK